MDAITPLAVAYGAKDLVVKLLGPTADYLGAEVQHLTQKGVENIKRVFDVAIRKTGVNLDDGKSVPPRILKDILDQGYFCDDELLAEYLGGVLASSRSGVSRDDRGTAFLTLIRRLSSYQLAAHYGFFAAYHELFQGVTVDFRDSKDVLDHGAAFMTLADFVSWLSPSIEEDPVILLQHIVSGLVREGIILEQCFFGNPLELDKQCGLNISEDGVLFFPSPVGIQLFSWVHNAPNLRVEEFTSGLQFERVSGVSIPRLIRITARLNFRRAMAEDTGGARWR